MTRRWHKITWKLYLFFNRWQQRNQLVEFQYNIHWTCFTKHLKPQHRNKKREGDGWLPSPQSTAWSVVPGTPHTDQEAAPLPLWSTASTTRAWNMQKCGRLEGQICKPVPWVEAAGHAWESACCWGPAHITRPGAQLTEVLDFWFYVRERKVMGTYMGLGKGRMWQWNILEWGLWKKKCAVPAHILREDREVGVLRQLVALSSRTGRGSRWRGLWNKWQCDIELTVCTAAEWG